MAGPLGLRPGIFPILLHDAHYSVLFATVNYPQHLAQDGSP